MPKEIKQYDHDRFDQAQTCVIGPGEPSRTNYGNIIAYIGPSIHKCCFEIGPEVSKKFPKKFQINGNGDRFFLDLQELIKHLLVKNSILINNIISSNECTKCNADKFYSYRRSGLKSGRMIGVIGLT